MIPFMSEFEILSSTKNAERMSELETEIILKILDKLMSITAIFIFYYFYYIFIVKTSIYIDII
jgi:hypothetical protein